MAYYIGIDTGTHTGLAVWDTTSRSFVEVVTLPLWKALDWVRDAAIAHGGQVRVYFEDARKRKWFEPELSRSDYRGKLMGAGSIKRDAAIWEEFLHDNGIPFVMLPPHAGMTKWKPEYWAKVTGWQGRTSEHARDAALLVFNRK